MKAVKIKKMLAWALLLVMVFSIASCTTSEPPLDYAVLQAGTESAWKLEENDIVRYEALKTHLDNVLLYGQDKVGTQTPLFYGGIDIDTKEPMVWENYISDPGDPYVYSNFAAEQNLLRAFDMMSKMSKNPKYRDAGAETTQYMFDNFVSDIGVLYWGGHTMIDLRNEKLVTSEDFHHELRAAFPYYRFLAEVDQAKTKRFLEAMWRIHLTFKNIDGTVMMAFNRHGYIDAKKNKLNPEKPFEVDYTVEYPILFSAKQLSFAIAAADLIYAGVEYYKLTEDPNSLKWIKTFTGMYERAAWKETGILPAQYSFSGSDDLSDRAYLKDKTYHQLGEDFGIAGSTVWYWPGPDAVFIPLSCFYGYELLGEPMAELKDRMVEYMRAYFTYAFNEDGTFNPILADGTNLSGYSLKMDGYLGAQGTTFNPRGDGNMIFTTAALRCYEYTEDPFFWNIIRAVCKRQGLGDIGSAPGVDTQMNLDTKSADPYHVMTLTELYEFTKVNHYRDTARRVADNLVENNFQGGFLTRGKDYARVRFNDVHAWAIASLHASLIGQYDIVPPYMGHSVWNAEGYLAMDGVEYDHGIDPIIYDKKR